MGWEEIKTKLSWEIRGLLLESDGTVISIGSAQFIGDKLLNKYHNAEFHREELIFERNYSRDYLLDSIYQSCV